MFLYNWNKIFSEANGSLREINRIFKMMVEHQIPVNRYDKIYKYSTINFIGESFLVHPDVLLYNAYQYDLREISQYLALASVRSLADYLAYGKTTVDLLEVPVSQELYYDNRLLYVEDGHLHFLYEEVPKEKKQWH